jgi:hypothetical protein
LRTETLDLLDGDKAVLFDYFRHGTQSEIRRLSAKLLRPGDADKLAIAQKDGTYEKLLLDDPALAEIMNAIYDCIVVNQVQSWTFGDVSGETLKDVPESKYQMIITKCNQLYGGASPLAGNGAGK